MMDFDRASQVLSYDPESGHLTWRKTLSARAVVGRRAGSIVTHGYLRVCVDGRAYRSHRIAWLLSYGEWPPEEIDHVNGDPADNRLSNLRCATHAQNGANRDPRVGASGRRGVYPIGKRWQAKLQFEGRNIHVGMFDTLEDASAAYEAAATAHFADFRRAAQVRALIEGGEHAE